MKKIVSALALIALIMGMSPARAAEIDGDGPWADYYVDFVQGTNQDGSTVLPEHSSPADALGVAESSLPGATFEHVTAGYTSLGFGGSIILGFHRPIVNLDGPDFRIFQVTNAPEGIYSADEKVRVEVSPDGTTWTTIIDGVVGSVDLDLGPFDTASFIRLTDMSTQANYVASEDGYNLDGVKALHNGTSIWKGVAKKLSFWQNDRIRENNVWKNHSIGRGNACRVMWNQAIALNNNFNLNSSYNGVRFADTIFNTKAKSPSSRIHDGKSVRQIRAEVEQLTCVTVTRDTKKMIKSYEMAMKYINMGKYLTY